MGGVQAVIGIVLAVAASVAIGTGAGAVVGVPLLAYSADLAAAGINQAATGEQTNTFFFEGTKKTAKGFGASEEEANNIAIGTDIVVGAYLNGGASNVKNLGTIPKVVAGGGVAAKGVGQGFNSFSAFKRAFGPAGPGQAWHHIVEQTPGNIAKFGNQAIHNTGNLMKLPHGAGKTHARISGHYSSIQPFTNGQTVRKWLSTQSFQAQYDYGIQTLKNFGGKP